MRQGEPAPPVARVRPPDGPQARQGARPERPPGPGSGPGMRNAPVLKHGMRVLKYIYTGRSRGPRGLHALGSTFEGVPPPDDHPSCGGPEPSR